MAWDYFTEDELRCRCGCGQAKMEPEFMRKLVSLREKAGFPFHLTSAYRCPMFNEIVSLTGRGGPHTTGRAVDIALWGREAHWLISNAAAHGMSGIGINQKGTYTQRFIHVDDLSNDKHQPRPWSWTY
jgi:uncharacterized protein YcbK (DUF882 family)